MISVLLPIVAVQLVADHPARSAQIAHAVLAIFHTGLTMAGVA